MNDPEEGIRIAIVDDHPVACYGMQFIFDAVPGLEVTCVAGTLAALRTPGTEFNLVILDLYLDRGRASAGEIAAIAADCPVLVVSASARRQDVLAAIRAGASGYLVKAADREEFVDAVRTVAASGFYLSSQLADHIDASLNAGDPGSEAISLAPRERETLSLIAQGYTQFQAATRLGLSPATVDTYIKRIRRKLGPGNKADLTRRAIALGQIGQLEPFDIRKQPG